MTLRIAAAEARRLVLVLQGLADAPRRKLGADDLLALIERLGFVQVDSVNVVARAHHMILFARSQTYRPALLQRLLEREARLFENWTHDAAIIPTRFYPYWQVRFEHDRPRLKERYRRWFGGQHEERLEAVLAHVRQNGAVLARDFRDPERRRGGFWDWHPDKAALELLWRTGELAIGELNTRFGLAELGAGRGKRCFEWPRIDDEEQIALLDDLAFLEMVRLQVAAHACTQLDVLDR